MSHALHLDDACLLNVFRFLLPLPDLFNVARTCKRFQGLMHDKRMWLVVHPGCTSKELASGKVFPRLSSAVRASRPGDTIWLAPGAPHHVSDLTVPWPLHLVGGGLHPEDTTLLCAAGADAALDFRATGKLANLRVVAERGACVVHRRGQLRVERCVLECRALGLHHLCAPLVTLASVCHPPRVFEGTACMTGVGCGSLLVAETQLLGCAPAVRCHGSGALQDVRVLYHAPAPLFWFGVDCRTPGHFPRPAAATSSSAHTTPAATPPLKGAPPHPATPSALPPPHPPSEAPDAATCEPSSYGSSLAAAKVGQTAGNEPWEEAGRCGWRQGWAARFTADGTVESTCVRLSAEDSIGASAGAAVPGALVQAVGDAGQGPCGMLDDLEDLSDGGEGPEEGAGCSDGKQGHGRLWPEQRAQPAGKVVGSEAALAMCTTAHSIVRVDEATVPRPGRRRGAAETGAGIVVKRPRSAA